MKKLLLIILLWLPLALHANQDTIYHHTDTTSKVDEYQYYIDLTKKPDAIQNRYQSYRNAYLDLYKDNEAGTVTEDASKSYIAILPDGYDLARVGGKDTWLKTLKSNQDMYRRYRDYSILATVIVYTLSLIDAYVDAQLFDYDISPDLSVNIEPQINFDEQRRQSTELKLAIRF